MRIDVCGLRASRHHEHVGQAVGPFVVVPLGGAAGRRVDRKPHLVFPRRDVSDTVGAVRSRLHAGKISSDIGCPVEADPCSQLPARIGIAGHAAGDGAGSREVAVDAIEGLSFTQGERVRGVQGVLIVVPFVHVVIPDPEPHLVRAGFYGYGVMPITLGEGPGDVGPRRIGDMHRPAGEPLRAGFAG